MESKVYEIVVEKLENILSLLVSSVDGSVVSIIENLDLDLHKEFVAKIIKIPQVLGESLTGFCMWVVKQLYFKVKICVVDALVRLVCGSMRKPNAYALWDLVKEIGQKDNYMSSVAILNESIAM